MQTKKIVLLAGEGVSTQIIFHALQKQYNIHTVILEEKESTKKFIKRRIKMLGIIQVVGQIIFQLTTVKWLNIIAKKRLEEISNLHQFNSAPIPVEKIKQVPSVNHVQTIQLLQEIEPDLIIVNGTRIISKKVLQATTCKFINTHVGITPRYRGVHGGYWALINKEKEYAGVTVHFVDEGIDTGQIIDQGIITISEEDNFVTYPMLQLGVGIQLLLKAINSYFNQTLKLKPTEGPSQVYYHPTIWFYLYHRICRGIK